MPCVCVGVGERGGGGMRNGRATVVLLLWSTLTTDSWDALLPHPLREGPTGLPVAVLVCVVSDNESSSVNPGGLKDCWEAELVLLTGKEDRIQSFACTAGGGGGCGHG